MPIAVEPSRGAEESATVSYRVRTRRLTFPVVCDDFYAGPRGSPRHCLTRPPADWTVPPNHAPKDRIRLQERSIAAAALCDQLTIEGGAGVGQARGVEPKRDEPAWDRTRAARPPRSRRDSEAADRAPLRHICGHADVAVRRDQRPGGRTCHVEARVAERAGHCLRRACSIASGERRAVVGGIVDQPARSTAGPKEMRGLGHRSLDDRS